MRKDYLSKIFCLLIIFYSQQSVAVDCDIEEFIKACDVKAFIKSITVNSEYLITAITAITALFGVLLTIIRIGIGPLAHLRSWISSGENPILRLSELKSPNIVTVLFHKKLRKENLSAVPVITHINAQTANFFGIDSERANELEDEDADSLINRLEKFMEPDDYINFVGDQKRVQVEINRCIKYREQCNVKATAPMIFNNSHPDLNYRNKAFFPVIAHEMTQEKFKYDHIYAIVLYIDVTDLKTKVRKA